MYTVFLNLRIRFARVCSHVDDLMLVINFYLLNLSKRVIGIISLESTFSKFYRRHHDLVSKFNVGLKSLLHQGLSEPEFYDDLVYKFIKGYG